MPNARNFKVTHPIYAIGKIENKGIIQSQKEAHKKVRKRGDNWLFIKLVPKVLNNVFLFIGLATLITFNEF